MKGGGSSGGWTGEEGKGGERKGERGGTWSSLEEKLDYFASLDPVLRTHTRSGPTVTIEQERNSKFYHVVHAAFLCVWAVLGDASRPQMAMRAV